MRTKLGALLGAGGMLLLAASVTMAAPGGTPGKPSDSPGGGPPASHPGGGPPSDNPGGGPPSDNPGGGPPASHPGGGPPSDNPGGGPPSDNPGGGGSPTYEIEVTKTADPPAVPVEGGTVEFTVFVTATGTGFFQVVQIDDPLPGCTLGSAVVTSGDDDDKLEEGETWSFSCTVDDVTPGTENVATVHACHNVSACNHEAHDAQGVGSVTVEEGESPPSVDPSVDPGSPDPGSPDPSQDNAGLTQAPTDTLDGNASTVGDQRTLMLVLALGMLMASLILVTPARPVRVRTTKR